MEQDLKGLLEIARFRSGHEDLNDYMRLLRFSIGFKPRRLKRIANKLVFIVRVRPEIGPEESQEPDSPARTQKLLFGLCCLESQYPAVFRTLLRTLGDDGGLERLMNEQLQDTEQIHLLDESDSILGQASEKSKAVHHLIAFMDAFRDILCEGDWVRKLDKDVLRELRELTVLMSTTEGSRPQELHGDERRSAMTQFVMSVKDRLVTRLGDAAPKGSDVFIRNWASSRPWFGLWYTEEESRKAWGPGRVHYELSFDTQNEDILTVSLKFNTHRALELGVRQEKLAELKDLRELKDKGFRYKDYENGWVEIAKVLYQCHCDSIHDLNDDEMESAAEELSALIKATHNVFVAGLPAPSAPTERPSTASERAMSCRVCNSTMEAMTLKDGSVGYRCDTCRKIYKPKPTS
jgi:hypothetical protein